MLLQSSSQTLYSGITRLFDSLRRSISDLVQLFPLPLQLFLIHLPVRARCSILGRLLVEQSIRLVDLCTTC